MSLRVLLADAQEATREGVRIALEAHGMEIVAEVATAQDAELAAIGTTPDVCLIDADLPGGGVAAVAAIARTVPHTALVILAATADDDALFAALNAGARGYLLKDTDPDRLPFAVQGVVDGEAALPRVLVTRVLHEFRRRGNRGGIPDLVPGREGLSDREWEVLVLLDGGFSTRDIGRRLGISDVTVRRHVSGLVRKLGVSDRGAAVALLRRFRATG
ncbi:MAG: Two component transcriptional regulator, CheY family [Solirubrobacterales bacterium]|nr:Two component transcriptional regulator, CheY family [Solirubrobacterales bacterium]